MLTNSDFRSRLQSLVPDSNTYSQVLSLLEQELSYRITVSSSDRSELQDQSAAQTTKDFNSISGILSLISEPAFSIDEQGRILASNLAAEGLTQFSSAELKGMTLSSLFIPSDQETCIKQVGVMFLSSAEFLSSGTIQTNRGLMISVSSRLRRLEINETLRVGIVTMTALPASSPTENEIKTKQREYVTRILDTMPIGCMIFKPDTQVLYANPAAEAIFGYRLNEIQDQLGIDFIVPTEPRPYVKDLIDQLQDQSLGYDGIYPNVRKDGRIIMCKWRNVPITDPITGEAHVLCMIEEVTQSLQESDTLKRNEERYRVISELTSDYFYSSTVKNGTVENEWMSGNVLAATGYSREELHTSETWVTLIHPKDLVHVQADLMTVLRGEKGYVEFRIQGKDGTLQWLRNISLPLTDEDGKVIRIIGAIKNITAEKQNMLRLARLTEYLEKTNEVARIGIWEFDLKTSQPIWDKVICSIHEMPEDYVPSLEDGFRFYPEGIHRDTIEGCFKDAIKYGKQYDVELQIKTGKGRLCWVRVIGIPEMEDGQCVRLYGTFQDIDDRKRAEAEATAKQDYFLTLFKETMDAMFIVDIEHDLITECNPAALTLFEVEQKEDLLNTKGERFQRHPFDDKTREEIKLRLQSGDVYSTELRYVSAKGTHFWGQLTVKTITLSGKTMNYVRLRDITLLNNAREILEQSEKRLFWLMNALPVSVSLYNDKSLLFVNKAFCDFRGMPYDMEEVRRVASLSKQSPEYMLIHQDDMQAFVAELPKYREIVERGDILHVERRMRKLNTEEYKWFECVIYKDTYLDGSGMVVEVDLPINERKVLELTLQQSELRFRSIFNSASAGIAFATENKLLMINSAFAALTGYSEAELTQMDWRSLTHPEDLQREVILIAKLQAGEISSYALEKRYITKSGEIKWVSLSASVSIDDFGKKYGIVVVHDITKEREALEKIQENEQLLKAIYDAVFIGICLIDERGHFVELNPSFCAIVGYHRDEMIGKHFSMLFTEDRRQDWSTATSLSTTSETPYHGEFHFLHRDGHLILVNVATETIFFSNGDRYTVTTVQDITLSRQQSAELLNRNAQLTSLSDGLPNIMLYQFVREANGQERFTYLSNAVETISGISIEEGLADASSLFSMLVPSCLEKMQKHLDLSSQTGEMFDIEIEKVNRRGEKKISLLRSFPRQGLHGETIWDGVEIDITERKRQEAEITEIQTRIKNVLESSREGYLSLDSTHRIIYINSEFERILGKFRQELIGKSVWDVFPVEEGSLFKTNFDLVFNSGIKVQFDEYFIGLDIWLEVTAYPDTIGGVTIQCRDISERRRLEEAQRQNEDFLNSIYYGIGSDIFVLDSIGDSFRIVGLNPAHEESTGIPNHLLLGKRIDELTMHFTEAELSLLNSRYAECAAERKILVYEEEKRNHLTGKKGYWITTLTPLTDAHGKVFRIIGTSIDITARRTVEELLTNTNQMLTETERLAHIGSWNFDINTRVISWSDEVFRIYDRHPEKGAPSVEEFFSLTHPQDFYALKEAVENAIHSLIPYELELRIVSEKGTLKWVYAIGKPGLDKDGQFIRLYGTIMDISAEKESEMEREKIYAQLLQSQKMESVGILASGVAHEFNNILMGIMGNAELLMRTFDDETRDVTRIKQILDNSYRAANIIRQMLGFARQGKTERRQIELLRCVENVIHIVEPSLDKRISIHLVSDPEIPMISGDPGQLEQVILNLTVNARDAISCILSEDRPFGQIRIELTFESIPHRFTDSMGFSDPRRFVHLAIRDNGSGIAEQIRNKIFEPFFTTKEVGKGTGLGLAMVYGIIKNHNAYIFLDSAEGIGSTFHLFFPTDEEVILKPTSETQTVSTESQKPTLRILVIDDEPQIREYLTDAFESEGHIVLTADNGKHGLEVFYEHEASIDVIIIDKNMPLLSGDETIRKIREGNTSVKIILMTGYLDNEENDILKSFGISSIISKPFDLLTLFHSLYN